MAASSIRRSSKEGALETSPPGTLPPLTRVLVESGDFVMTGHLIRHRDHQIRPTVFMIPYEPDAGTVCDGLYSGSFRSRPLPSPPAKVRGASGSAASRASSDGSATRWNLCGGPANPQACRSLHHRLISVEPPAPSESRASSDGSATKWNLCGGPANQRSLL